MRAAVLVLSKAALCIASLLGTQKCPLGPQSNRTDSQAGSEPNCIHLVLEG